MNRCRICHKQAELHIELAECVNCYIENASPHMFEIDCPIKTWTLEKEYNWIKSKYPKSCPSFSEFEILLKKILVANAL